MERLRGNIQYRSLSSVLYSARHGLTWGASGVQSLRGTSQEHTIRLQDCDLGKPHDNLVVRKCSCFLLNNYVSW